MSDQARDDLVAAMEAQVSRHEHFDDSQDYRRLCRAEREAATRFLRDHGKHLLALLDAEPVAWRVDGFAPDYAIFTTKVDRANLPRQRGVTVTALYARPEASDE